MEPMPWTSIVLHREHMSSSEFLPKEWLWCLLGLIFSQGFSLGGRITRDFRFQTYFLIFQIFYNGRDSFYYLKKKSPPKHYWKNKCKKLCQPNLTQNSSSMFFVFRGLNLLFIKFYPLRETKTQTIFFSSYCSRFNCNSIISNSFPLQKIHTFSYIRG